MKNTITFCKDYSWKYTARLPWSDNSDVEQQETFNLPASSYNYLLNKNTTIEEVEEMVKNILESKK